MRSVSQVEALGPDGPVLLTSQQEVEQHLSEALALRFQLTAHSPFLTDPLRYDLGLLGTSPASQAILQGTYICPAGMDLYTQQLLSILKLPQQTTPVSSVLSCTDFINHWRKSKERTSSSYSGLHYGHYKASIDNPRISEFHALFTEMAFNHGYSPSHWQSSLQVLLEKKPGAIRVADLCTLGLLEADFNAGMKILVGHRMVCQALQSNLLPSECYGSVPGCRAIQVSLCRCLLADVSRQRRHPLVVVSEDAARCYDQIAHCPAALACQHLGVSPQVMVTIFATIQLMKFFLRTAYGDSATFYGGGLSQYPFQGVCQGNGAGPAIWLALSLCLIHMIHQFGYPNQLTSAISLSSIILVGFIYVDDCDLFVLAPPSNLDPQEVLTQLQKNMDIWQGGLESTGGSLSAENAPGVGCFTTLKRDSGNSIPPLPSQRLSLSGKASKSSHSSAVSCTMQSRSLGYTKLSPVL